MLQIITELLPAINIAQIKAQLSLWRNQYEKLPLRVSLLVTATILLGLNLIWENTIEAGLKSNRSKLQATNNQLNQYIMDKTIEIDKISSDSLVTKVKELKALISKTKAENTRLQNQIETSQASLKQQKHSIGILSRLLSQTGNIEITNFNNTAENIISTSDVTATELNESGQAKNFSNNYDSVNNDSSKNANTYKHIFELGLRGDYYDIKAFIQNLEKANRAITWHHIEYKVTEHPLAEVKLKLSIISDSKDLVKFN